MPNKYIEIPDEVRFVDPKSKEEIEGEEGVFNLEILLHKISDNPKWNLSYKLGRVMDALWEAWESRDESYGRNGLMIVGGEDFKEFLDTVENPKQLLITVQGPQTIAGFGIHPRMSRQLLSVTGAVVNALDKDPRKTEKKKDAEKGDDGVAEVATRAKPDNPDVIASA